MDVLEILILGIVQGLTEFLPVSSSGHLVVMKEMLGVDAVRDGEPVIEVALHVGTLIAILAYYRNDVLRSFKVLALEKEERTETRGLLKWIVVGTVPTVIIALLFKDWLESCFTRPVLVGAALCFTGALCLATRFIPRGADSAGKMGVLRSLLVGCAQGMAIIPGISRSGATIAFAMAMRVEPREAGRYSFLLSVPAVAGAAVLTLVKSASLGSVSMTALVPGVLASAVVGVLCLGLLTRILKSGSFFYFGFYCIPLGLLVILYFV
jgi:undecaprenyl-diphosphatase